MPKWDEKLSVKLDALDEGFLQSVGRGIGKATRSIGRSIDDLKAGYEQGYDPLKGVPPLPKIDHKAAKKDAAAKKQAESAKKKAALAIKNLQNSVVNNSQKGTTFQLDDEEPNSGWITITRYIHGEKGAKDQQLYETDIDFTYDIDKKLITVDLTLMVGPPKKAVSEEKNLDAEYIDKNALARVGQYILSKLIAAKKIENGDGWKVVGNSAPVKLDDKVAEILSKYKLKNAGTPDKPKVEAAPEAAPEAAKDPALPPKAAPVEKSKKPGAAKGPKKAAPPKSPPKVGPAPATPAPPNTPHELVGKQFKNQKDVVLTITDVDNNVVSFTRNKGGRGSTADKLGYTQFTDAVENGKLVPVEKASPAEKPAAAPAAAPVASTAPVASGTAPRRKVVKTVDKL